VDVGAHSVTNEKGVDNDGSWFYWNRALDTSTTHPDPSSVLSKAQDYHSYVYWKHPAAPNQTAYSVDGEHTWLVSCLDFHLNSISMKSKVSVAS